MKKETLLTFSFNAPLHTNCVELFGSWDNFSHAYTMVKDRRRSTTHWTGCFRFKNVIYDGISSTFAPPRNGGLIQGGVYWYFFRLDDSIEAYDEAQLSTSACPLLPGQMMNVVEVPLEAEQELMRPRSDSGVSDISDKTGLSHYTLDPATKFAPLCPPKHNGRPRFFTYSGADKERHSTTIAELCMSVTRSEPRKLSNLWRSIPRISSPAKSSERESKVEHKARPESRPDSGSFELDDEYRTIPERENSKLSSSTSSLCEQHFGNELPSSIEGLSKLSPDLTSPTVNTSRQENRKDSRNGDVPEQVLNSLERGNSPRIDCKDNHDGEVPDQVQNAHQSFVVLRDANNVDGSSASMIAILKATSRWTFRSINDEQHSYQVNIPQELSWPTPQKQMIESIHQIPSSMVD